MALLAFIDTETTGLDPEHHQIWELALLLVSDGTIHDQRSWQFPVDLGRADPRALEISHFYERSHQSGITGASAMTTWTRAAPLIGKMLHGAHLIGAVPSFDEERLRRALQRGGGCVSWHYQPRDVETLAVGYCRGKGVDLTSAVDENDGSWNSDALSRLVGVDPDRFERHTAMGDVHWAKAIWDAVMA